MAFQPYAAYGGVHPGGMQTGGYGPQRGAGFQTAAGPYAGAQMGGPVNSLGYPMRPGMTPCSFYMKTGSCKFGQTCKWDHPDGVSPSQSMPPPSGPAKGKGKGAPQAPINLPPMDPNVPLNSTGYPYREGVGECKFYMKEGFCMYQHSCKWHHPEGIMAAPAASAPSSGVSSRGLPLRGEAEVCSFFAKTGSCKFGSSCKFSHPDEAAGTQQIPLSQPTSSPPAGNPAGVNSLGFPLRPHAAPCSYYLKHGTCSFGPTCMYNHPDQQQQQQQQQQQSYAQQPSPYAPQQPYGQPAYAQPAYAQQPGAGPMATVYNSIGYPVRAAEPCSFFTKTGSCAFGQTCKYDHPEASVVPGSQHVSMTGGKGAQMPSGKGQGKGQQQQQQQHQPAEVLNAYGLPARAGAAPCSFYMQTGSCKFGNTCKYDHPVTGEVGQAAMSGAADSPEPDGINSKSLPMRVGTPDCRHYLSTGTCSYGMACKWNHPEG